MATPNPHASCNKMRAYAWAKYYESINARLTDDHRNYTRTQLIQETTDIPTHIKNEFLAMGAELKKTWECPVCMEMIQPDNLDITNCGHYFCKPCLVSYKANALALTVSAGTGVCKCPICRRKISG